jgi:hypothetical protein
MPATASPRQTAERLLRAALSPDPGDIASSPNCWPRSALASLALTRTAGLRPLWNPICQGLPLEFKHRFEEFELWQPGGAADV